MRKLNTRTTLLFIIFAIVLTYYTTGGRFISRSDSPKDNFWRITIQSCQPCNLTWLDRILFRRCFSYLNAPDNICDQYTVAPSGYKKVITYDSFQKE